MTNYPEIRSYAERFAIEGEVVDVSEIQTGHINSTFVVVCKKADGSQVRYILQTVNTSIFKDPEALMENISGVTNYLKKIIIANGGDTNRETLTLIPTKEGKNYLIDETGACRRMYNFIENATSYQSVERPILFENAAKAFGKFQRQLASYDAASLHETIAHFHDTPKRFCDFEKAVKDDIAHRADTVKDEIAFFFAHKDICSAITDKIATGEVPLRVTHNDTKLNNIMIDNDTDEGICIIDLDTVMPGSALYDFGDSIRFGASSAAEDEKDLSKVHFVPALFEAYVRGYLSEAGEALTEAEKDLIPMSCVLMTLECGMRFLGDYLNGDVYFATHREGHNLDRARTQIKLVSEMEAQLDEMHAIVAKYR